jgi:uncharacterized protein YggU (UPF0235/DUF167 family)
VRIRLTPRGSANCIAGLVGEADGGVALKVQVTAVAEHGKANDALLGVLAGAWGVAKRDLAIVAGTTDRRKIVRVAGVAAQLLPILERSIAGMA